MDPVSKANFSLDVYPGEDLIITAPDLFEEASELEEFHDGDVSTDVIKTTWIYENYDEASYPPYEGYTNSSIEGWRDIEGYNFTLARRIIAFLNDSRAHPNLKYVTLFGDASLVPPSYYVYFAHWDVYNNWIPTDFFYGFPDYDLVPSYAVGRLPVRNSEEADHVVQKIISWNENLDWDWFKNVDLVGGNLWDTPFYDGELVLMESVNRDYFNGMEIEKLFRTEDKFDRASVLDSFTGENGITYIITHGYGDSIATENDRSNVTVDDLMSLPPNPRVPIVVSFACMDGAFDTGLYPNTLYGYPQETSFGEAVLLSNASGVAYIRSSRVTHGSIGYHLDKGYLNVIKEPYMLGMLTYVFEAYHEGLTLGTITKKAINSFVEENDFSHDILKLNSVTLFEFVLLGDPVLGLPKKPGPSYQKPNLTTGSVEFKNDTYLSQIASGEVPTYEVGEKVNIGIETDSPNVAVKRINVYADHVDERTCANTENAEYTFTASDKTLYLIRAEADDGKEGCLLLLISGALPVEFTGNLGDHGLDTDEDGLYDYLVVEAEVNATKAGPYVLSAPINYWDGESWQSFNFGSELVYLDVGVRTISLKFGGASIRDLGYNGTFLVLLELMGPMAVLYDSAEYETGYYTGDQFQNPPAKLNLGGQFRS